MERGMTAARLTVCRDKNVGWRCFGAPASQLVESNAKEKTRLETFEFLCVINDALRTCLVELLQIILASALTIRFVI
jgi:hypothetical protein